MTLLFALIPMLLAVAIFVGTFKLGTPRVSAPEQRPVVTQTSKALRTPLPPGAVRREDAGRQLRV
jgi:hypothetical protein